MLCDRPDVIVLTDEAHRSQYDTLALNMRAALPKALFLAFTGTPLIAGEERTQEVFGDYVSIYDFQQSVEDGATVPLFYENRTPELQLVNPDLNDDIYALIEAADSTRSRRAKLERELGRQYHLHHPRRPAGDGGAGHRAALPRAGLSGQGDGGVHRQGHRAADARQGAEALGRRNAARVESGDLRVSRRTATRPTRTAMRELQQRLDVLTTTDMAVIVSPGQNEIEQMKELGLDIVPHRKRMNDRSRWTRSSRTPNDPLRLVFVCAMWLTGFDAPSCSTVYLDKPMRNHTLMQTIARANRVFPGKHSGLIVDYANVFASLEKALAIYAKGQGGHDPGSRQAAARRRTGPTLETVVIQDAGGTRAAIDAGVAGALRVAERVARVERQEVPARHLALGVQCGGSDGFSAVTANPALGRAADLLVADGATVLLSETPAVRDRGGDGGRGQPTRRWPRRCGRCSPGGSLRGRRRLGPGRQPVAREPGRRHLQHHREGAWAPRQRAAARSSATSSATPNPSAAPVLSSWTAPATTPPPSAARWHRGRS